MSRVPMEANRSIVAPSLLGMILLYFERELRHRTTLKVVTVKCISSISNSNDSHYSWWLRNTLMSFSAITVVRIAMARVHSPIHCLLASNSRSEIRLRI